MKQKRSLIRKSISLFFVCLVSITWQERGWADACSQQQMVQVETMDETHKTLICDAAARALDFLAAYGLSLKRPIVIAVIDTLIDNQGYIAIGSYDSRTDKIQIMSLAAIRAGSEDALMYDEPFDEEHYGGAVAHEVAHAVMHHNMKVKPLSTSPQEYLAHATQMAVLSEARRNCIIKRADVASWLPGDSISEIYMAMQPTRFAVKSYLHLTTMDKPMDFITILLNTRWFYVYVP